ncbi:phytanoyl-CoA dioxygenase family protein [Parafilimonas sp.]|uniref:phytanoyl-CoA dioxygenase family protein n=1 Tax=Parafilimonas sp. TaxID=1969739 RepID=UPI0039E5FAD4
MLSISPSQLSFFEEKGYLVVENILNKEEIAYYRDIYEKFLTNQIDVQKYRSDLGSHAENDLFTLKQERITQIMLASRLFPELLDQPLHKKALSIAKQLLGEDMALDFDMLISKAPHSATATPWHQDRAYWITMPDTRSASCWVALDDATKDNGCMWYVEGSHKLPVRGHRPAGKGGGALECDASEEEGIAVEIKAGCCIWHHGGTLHYSRGNTTNNMRRAFITNYRPEAMIAYEREQGFDHSGERNVRDSKAKNQQDSLG